MGYEFGGDCFEFPNNSIGSFLNADLIMGRY